MRPDRCLVPESHNGAFPGNDCKLAFGWGHQVGMAWNYWHCKNFVREVGGTGSWVKEEWVGVEEEGVSPRWLDSGVAGE